MKKRFFQVLRIIVFLFLLSCLFQSYSFTHPKDSSQGYDVDSFRGIVHATVFGITPTKFHERHSPTDFGLTYELVSFKSRDGLTLSGWFIPVNDSLGTIVLAHGYNSDKAGLLSVAKEFHDRRYSVFLFDFRAFGESSGSVTSIGYTEQEDVLGAVDYVHSRTVHTPLYGYGVSMGGAALIFAESKEHVFDVLVVDSVYPSLETTIARRFKNIYGFPRFPFATTLTFFGGVWTGVNGFKISPEESMRSISIPVLVIQGDLDKTISPSESERLVSASSEHWLIVGAGHIGGFSKAKEEYMTRVVGFFQGEEVV